MGSINYQGVGNYQVRDSYTGYVFCKAHIHLLTPENRGPGGNGCRLCMGVEVYEEVLEAQRAKRREQDRRRAAKRAAAKNATKEVAA